MTADGPVEAAPADLPADPAADDAAIGSPAGGDGPSPDRLRGHLPGDNSAPGIDGRGEVSLFRGGEAAHRPAVEVATPASAAGRLLASHVTWWCPRCLNARELPRRCCPADLIRARVTVTEEAADA